MDNKQWITGFWGHIFEGERSDRMTRIVLDPVNQKLVAAQVQRQRAMADSFSNATADEMSDLEDSLVNANGELFTTPGDYGLERVDELPEWAA
ncbi:MAG: hypothetical protein RSG77_21825 [Hafnia sp.]